MTNWTPSPEQAQAHGAVVGHDGLETILFQSRFQEVGYPFLVFNDQDCRHDDS